MKKAISLRCPLLIAAILLAAHAPGIGISQKTDLCLMPVPEQITMSTGRLSIDGSFRVCLSGCEDARLPRAVARFLTRLRGKTGIPLDAASLADPDQATFEIRCHGAGEQVQSANADESYTLEVTGRRARLAAPSPIGILRGLETLLQLVDSDRQSFFVPSLSIADRPRFCWRGLLIDVSRHWEPVEIIKRNLDAMAVVKMNVFHWHLSDDQGFRMESRAFPKLHKKGSDGKYYTQGEVREIVAYARDRGIRVIPEFDMPGHTTAWLVAYPELASAPGPYKIERSWGVFDPCMDPTRKKLYSFLDSFIGEMAGLFPDEYFHIGGDEVNGKQWSASSRIRSFKRRENLQNNRDLQAYFNQRLLKILAGHGKRMIGWDEILHPDLPNGITVQSWRGQASLAESARRGHSGILSYGYYLDHMRPASFHYETDPLGKEAANFPEDEKSGILGGEACMWGEFVTPDNIESRIWPRTAAIAERLWSPSDVRDITDMYRRLEYLSRELDSLGLTHQTGYIEMLRRMLGDQHLAPLKDLADLLKPTGLGTRQRSRQYTSLTPLNRMADVILPESKAARHLECLVQDALSSGPASADLFRQMRQLLAGWRQNESRLDLLLQQSSLLKEISPVSKTVSLLSERGLQALDYLESGQKPPEAWRNDTALFLDLAEKPQAEVLPAIAPPIKRLIQAASALP